MEGLRQVFREFRYVGSMEDPSLMCTLDSYAPQDVKSLHAERQVEYRRMAGILMATRKDHHFPI